MGDIPCYLCSNTVFQLSQSSAKALTCTQKTGLDPDPGKSQGKYTKKQKREKLKFETILGTDTQNTFHLLRQGWTAPLNSFSYNCSCRQDAGEKGERIRGQRDRLSFFLVENSSLLPTLTFNLCFFFSTIRDPNQPSSITHSCLCGANRFVSILLFNVCFLWQCICRNEAVNDKTL